MNSENERKRKILNFTPSSDVNSSDSQAGIYQIMRSSLNNISTNLGKFKLKLNYKILIY